jgi:hypothetical protein
MSPNDPAPYARQQDPTPYGVDEWPSRLGFVFVPGAGAWVRGAWRLTRVVAKYWLLAHPDYERPKRITTGCRNPEGIALDLAWQVREAVEAA